eukprot:5624657-Amphidinium_carterae.1
MEQKTKSNDDTNIPLSNFPAKKTCKTETPTESSDDIFGSKDKFKAQNMVVQQRDSAWQITECKANRDKT